MIKFIENFELNKIIPYEKNPRKISNDAIKLIVKSIENFGWQQPIVIDKNNIIIVGHGRALAAKKLKLKFVPVIIADNLSPGKVKAYRIMDNKTNELSEWDMELLKIELTDLSDEDFGFEFGDEFNLSSENLIENIKENENFSPKYSIILECESEEQQQELYEEFKRKNLKCKILSI